jgi:multidrug efflux pump
MNSLIDGAFSRSRTVALSFIMIVILGTSAYVSIPKESDPDIPIPTIYVSVSYEGIAPEDAERLLLKPLEKELQSLEGLKEMRGMGAEGFASVTLEFDAGFNPDLALQDVREKVDLARAELPQGTDEPRVTEVNVALFPVLTVILSGEVPERTLLVIARSLQDQIEGLSGVLEVDIGGQREELLEVIIEPNKLETYHLSLSDVFDFVTQNNRLVAAGALDQGAGRMVFKVPGVIEGLRDLQSLPIKRVGDTIVTFEDVATIRRTFKDPRSFARIQGETALALEISKRTGANIIETIAEIKNIVEQNQLFWPASIKTDYLQDKSEQIKNILGDLENNVITAIILVMIVIITVLGVRPSILVGLSIPGSFLAGMLVINALGMTLNIVVLFSLILVVGMLVDGAIVTVELADRKMSEGATPKEAFAAAAKRMSWPIIASTATTLVVFFPLLFWPGMVGEWMKFLPLTVIITLGASLFMALIFIPVLGGIITSDKVAKNKQAEDLEGDFQASQDGDLHAIKGGVGVYLRSLEPIINHPKRILVGVVLSMILAYAAYFSVGKGVEFFPSIEPEFVQVQVQARGDLSITERDFLVRQVEQDLLTKSGIESVYARTMGGGISQNNMPEDVIGVIQLELTNWQKRPPAADIMKQLRREAGNIPGIKVQIREQESGPGGGKPFDVEISAIQNDKLEQGVEHFTQIMREVGGFVDIEDSRALPSIEWKLKVDREKAAQFDADVTLIGNVVTMITNGVLLAEYRPDDAEEELEIRLRFPQSERNLQQLNELRIPTSKGNVPIRNFVTFEPAQKIGRVNRTDGRKVMTIKAAIEEGILADQQVTLMKNALQNSPLPQGVMLQFKGEDEDLKETMAFLQTAFIIAILMMSLILLTQFNSFYQSFIVLSAIVFSTTGVFIGLLLTGQTFGVVMSGIGIIALAGIVVNNNIVLIDTFNDLKSKGLGAREAILRTCAQRMRPVLLTSVTTVLGLIPMVFGLTIDILGREITVGAPSSQWWTQLSSTIAGGLTFATFLTLFLTPCMLMIGEQFTNWRKKSKNVLLR